MIIIKPTNREVDTISARALLRTKTKSLPESLGYRLMTGKEKPVSHLGKSSVLDNK